MIMENGITQQEILLNSTIDYKLADSWQKNSDKSDRATVEQVLDPRTRIILFKMINCNVIYEINGCVSTGKETNVYHVITEDGNHSL
ncbi:serine/threonine-protein kinase Rio1 [Rhizophagus irregularis DAOM 181602=DAOM 197198]|nr:serine/threonine-protein kinase Rio1 [Rhizophagus irregularis DAOM 181602=DAOM 197198]